MTLHTLRTSDIQVLERAIEWAESWRGSKAPEDWAAFDEEIADMRHSLERANTTRMELARLKTANKRLQERLP